MSAWLGLALVVLSMIAAATNGLDLVTVIAFVIGLWMMSKGET